MKWFDLFVSMVDGLFLYLGWVGVVYKLVVLLSSVVMEKGFGLFGVVWCSGFDDFVNICNVM